MATIRFFKPTDLVGLAAETVADHADWVWGSVAITQSGIRLDYDRAADGGIAALRVSQSARISFEIAELGSHQPASTSWDSYWTGNLRPLLNGMLAALERLVKAKVRTGHTLRKKRSGLTPENDTITP